MHTTDKVLGMGRPVKATHQETRAHNERLVLATIYDDGPISRAAVARATGLTRTTVSDVVSGLLDGGLTREIGRGPSTGGKAPILLEVADDARHLIGIDLGEQVFRGGIVNLRGQVVSSLALPIEGRDGQAAVERVFELIDGLVARARRPIVGIGIGTPGLSDTAVGTVLQAVNLDWRELPLGRLVQQRYEMPAYVANDSQAIALAEYVFGGPRTSNLIVVKVGHGIGAGVILDGELFQGDGFGAGEIGHTSVVPDGARCRCGGHGCLETVASTSAVIARLGRDSALGGADGSVDQAVIAFRRGEAQARAAVLDAARYLGVALAGLVGALNVRRIVLVGTMTAFGDPWLRVVREAMRTHVLALLAAETNVEIGRLDEDGVVLGASALLLTHELGLIPLPSAGRGRS
ncbi:MAG: ROK family protein [Candidatus Limnocylindrales bacterium]